MTERWAAAKVASISGLHDAALLDGFVAELGGQTAGLVTYRVEGDECEVVTLDSLSAGHGIGRALLQAVADHARAERCRRV
jgi:GNAT superfamily N-acetyltransferase